MLRWYRELIQLRRNSTSLNDGDAGHVKVSFDEKDQWLVMDRGIVKVMCNLGDELVKLDNPGALPLLLASRGDVRTEEGKVLLPRDSLAILSAEKL
jgi:maltooligosyltrehalose trehalohydrolase